MRLHILGAGAIGRVFANRMIRAGVETTLLLRPVRVEALKRSGRMTDAIVQEKKVEVQVLSELQQVCLLHVQHVLEHSYQYSLELQVELVYPYY